jgi:uncharacterized iron-regulated membrane protein
LDAGLLRRAAQRDRLAALVVLIVPGRQAWVLAHRWAGLTLALFLAVAGLTGSLLPWIEEIEAATAPALHRVAQPFPGARPMDAQALRAQTLARHPGARIDFLPLTHEADASVRLYAVWQDPAAQPDWDDVFLNPYTGAELGHRRWGEIGQGVKNLMPFVYRLHYSLALGQWGLLAFGLAALIWVVDCVNGFFLTFPVGLARRAPGQPSWWQRWRPSWAVRWRSSPYKLTFDLHRAGGLWLWPLLLVFAWSSVSFNLPQVYRPVMALFGGSDTEARVMEQMLPQPRYAPALDFPAAEAVGRKLARAELVRRGLTERTGGERWLWYVPASGLYVYGLTSSADIGAHGGGTRIAFDGNTGALREVDLPSGGGGANTFTNWIVGLHTAHVFGLWWRMAVTALGLGVTMLSVTGVLIWLRKRSARAGRRLKRLSTGERSDSLSVA